MSTVMSSLISTVLFLMPIVLAPISLAYLAYMFAVGSWKKSRLPLPPGPKGFPIVGNLFNLPDGMGHEWQMYDKLCEEYDTDILYLNMAGKHMVVVNTFDAAIELMDNRSAMYSGRPRMAMVNELMGWHFNFAWMDYGDRWREHRKLFHHAFQPSAVHQFKPQQLRAARSLVQRLGTTKNIMGEIRQMAGEIIISVAYGLPVLPHSDPYIAAAEFGVRALLDAANPGSFFVDFITAMKYIPSWMPGASFKRKAKEWRVLVERMLNLPFDAMVKSMADGTTMPSFGLSAMQAMQEGGVSYTEDDVKSVATTMYQTGSDTTLSTIAFCILSLLDNPEIYKTAQTEIDSITDSHRLPDFGDENLTPYLMAVIKETLRYWSIAPLSVAHYVTSEDEFQGYRIPADSIIVTNCWKMLHNPDVYPDPFLFKPERFLRDGQLAESNFEATWGFGRRICPGRHMAYQSVWIALATILSIYDLKKSLDVNGKPIEPSHEFKSSLLILPEPFECKFTVRSDASARLLAALSVESGEF